MTNELSQTVIDALLPLCAERQVEKDIRDAADARCDELSAQIGALLVEHGLVGPDGKAKVDLGFYGINLMKVPRSSIDADALKLFLAEKGVDTEIILGTITAATKTTYSDQVRVTQKKDKGQPS